MTPALHVRMASVADAANISAMSRELIEHGLPWTWRADRVIRAIAAPDNNVAVIRDEANLEAFGIMEYWDDDAHLVLFAVRRSLQRRGLGSALLRWLEASAVVAGSKRVRVEARRDNDAARNFYNEHGYHELLIEPLRYSGRLDGIRLEKWLHKRCAGDA